MKKFKKIFALILVLVLAVIFTSCGEAKKAADAQKVVDNYYKAIKEANFDAALALTANGTNVQKVVNEYKDLYKAEKFLSTSEKVPEGCEDIVKNYSEDIMTLTATAFSSVNYTIISTNVSEDIVVVKVNTNFSPSTLNFNDIQTSFQNSYVDKITNFTKEELAKIGAMEEKDAFIFTNKIGYDIYSHLLNEKIEQLKSSESEVSFYVQKIEKEWKIIEIK